MMLKRTQKKSLITLLLLFTLLVCQTPIASAQEDRWSGRTITGTAYFIGGRTSGRTLAFKVIVNHLSTSQDLSQLNTALQSGQDDLLRALSKMNAGRIAIGTGVGVTANAIFESDEGNGRTKLTVLYERNLSFGEVRFGARSENYRFGYAELFVGRGENEGMLIPAALVRLRNGNTWEVEDFGTFPARLMGLKVSGGRIS